MPGTAQVNLVQTPISTDGPCVASRFAAVRALAQGFPGRALPLLLLYSCPLNFAQGTSCTSIKHLFPTGFRIQTDSGITSPLTCMCALQGSGVKGAS